MPLRVSILSLPVCGPGNAHIQELAGAKAAMSDITILIVDDEPVVRSMCEAALTHNGYRVVSAFDGQDAINLLSQRPELQVNLALVDVLMPEMSGPEFAVELQRLRPGVAVLFMTGYPDPFTDLDSSGQQVLSKPFPFDALIARVRKILANTADGESLNSQTR